MDIARVKFMEAQGARERPSVYLALEYSKCQMHGQLVKHARNGLKRMSMPAVWTQREFTKFQSLLLVST